MKSHLLIFGILVASCYGSIFDEGLTNEASRNIQEDSLVFTFGRVSRHGGGDKSNQVLVSLAFEEDQRFAVVLDRVTSEVTFETVMGGEVEKQSVSLKKIPRKNNLKHLIVELLQHSSGVANVYQGCHLVGSLNIPKTPKQMSLNGKDSLRVYRDERLDVSIDGQVKIQEVLKKLGCSDVTLKNSDNIQSQSSEVYTYRRGDIPVQHEEETGTILVKTLSELIETIKELQVEIQTQREETALLRDALLNCEACKPGRGRRRG